MGIRVARVLVLCDDRRGVFVRVVVTLARELVDQCHRGPAGIVGHGVAWIVAGVRRLFVTTDAVWTGMGEMRERIQVGNRARHEAKVGIAGGSSSLTWLPPNLATLLPSRRNGSSPVINKLSVAGRIIRQCPRYVMV